MDLEYSRIWGIKCSNLTMSRIYLGKFESWSGLEHRIPNLIMSQIHLGKFGSWSDLEHPVFKSDHVSDSIWDIPSWIWDTIRFQTRVSQIGNSDLECSKSKFRFGNVPNQIRNKIAFGLQHRFFVV